MQIKNKTMAIVITMILVTSMAISIGSLSIPPAQAVVINGINYDQLLLQTQSMPVCTGME